MCWHESKTKGEVEMQKGVLSLLLVAMVFLTVCPDSSGQEPSLPPPVFKTAPAEGSTVEALLPYGLFIEWFVLEEYENAHLQIARDEAFTMLIVNVIISDQDNNRYITQIVEEGTYYIRIRKEDYWRSDDYFSKWVTRSFTLKKIKQWPLTVNTTPEGAGNISVDPEMPMGGYADGTVVSLTVTAETAYQFSKWMPSGETPPTITIIMDQDRDVTAEFTFRDKLLTLVATPEGGGTIAADPAIPPEGYSHGTTVRLTATASQGYIFLGWEPSKETSKSIEIVMDGDKNITAVFAANKMLTLKVTPEGGGIVVANPVMPPGGYPHGTEVSLTATAETGYTFLQWKPYDVRSTRAFIVMDRDYEVTAVFVPDKILTMHIIPPGSGKIIADPVMPTTGYPYGTDVILTAIPNSGYKFIRWDPSAETSTILDITMSADKTVSAVFERTNEPIEGEVPVEGEALTEGESTEGETTVEGESAEGESAEGETVPDNDEGGCGGCGGTKALKDALGDWLLVGLSLLLLAGMRRV